MSAPAEADTAPSTAPAVQLRTSSTAQTWAMSKRAIVAFGRQPALIVPPIFFSLFFAALGSSAFSRATQLPGFPEVDSYLDFVLAGSVVQSILFGSTVGATALATDIENGFFDRLLSAPTSRWGIIVGRLAGGMAFGLLQTVFIIAVLLPFGLTVQSGIAGVIVMAIAGMAIALMVGGLMSALAIKTGSPEAVQGAFPLLFIGMFFSSAFFPRETMSGAYAAIADVNPISHLVEGMRDLTIEGLTVSAVLRAVAIPAAASVVTIALALRTLHSRLGAR